MKKIFCALLIMTFTVGMFAQGTVQFNNSLAGYLTKVYLPDGITNPSNPYFSPDFIPPKNGNTSTDSMPGTQTYTGSLLTGNYFTAQIWSAPGSGRPEGSLVGCTTTTFRTGAGAGRLAITTATLSNVAPDASVATLQIRVFPTSYGTWANALAAYNAEVDPFALIGTSNIFDVSSIGGSINTPPAMTELMSFSLSKLIIGPEPSSLVIAFLGGTMLLTSRRRRVSK